MRQLESLTLRASMITRDKGARTRKAKGVGIARLGSKDEEKKFLILCILRLGAEPGHIGRWLAAVPPRRPGRLRPSMKTCGGRDATMVRLIKGRHAEGGH